MASQPHAHRSTSEKPELEEAFAISCLDPQASCEYARSSFAGLTNEEALRRLDAHGLNLVTRERKPTILQEIWTRTKNALNALLLTLACVSYFLGDVRAAVVIAVMVLLAIATAF